MYSESRRSSLPRIRLILAVATLAVMLPACGKKGSPLPPPSKLPQPVNDLKVEQWGDNVRLEFTYPTVTVGGLPLTGIKTVEVWEVVRPFVVQPTAPEETTEDTTEKTGEASEPTSEHATSSSQQTSGSSSNDTTTNSNSSDRRDDSRRNSDSDRPPHDNHLHQSQETNGGNGQQQQGSTQNQGQSQSGNSSLNSQSQESQQQGEQGAAGEEQGEASATAGPTTPAAPQPTISASDFKANAKQIATVEGDDLTAAILGGKIILQVPTSALGALPKPEPGEEKTTDETSPEQKSSTSDSEPSQTQASKTQASETQTSEAQTSETETVAPAEPISTAPDTASTGADTQATTEPASSSHPNGPQAPSTQSGEPTTPTTAPAMPQMTVEEVHFFAIRTISDQGKTSDYSRVAYLVPETPAPAPTGLTATSTDSGIDLSWTLPLDVEIEGVQVYRRDKDQSVFEDPLTQAAADATEYTDRTAGFDKQYTYAVAVVTRKRPLVQSALSNEATVDYKDIYPPKAPPRLALFAEPNRVRLIWEAPSASDVAGYRVERAQADGKFEILNKEMVKTPEYIDRNVTRGVTYSYRVIALDTTGNASEPSSVESARIP